MIINGPDDSISKISMQKKVVRETAVAIKLIYSIRYTITIYRYTIKQLNILYSLLVKTNISTSDSITDEN